MPSSLFSVANSLRQILDTKRWLWILGLFGLAVLFIVLRWNNFNAPLTRDEGEYAYTAQILEHGVAPYEHAFLQKPPMVVYSYLFSFLFAPDTFWAPRMLAGIFVTAATVLLGFVAYLEFGEGVALPTMYLLTPMLLLPEVEQFAPNTEMFMLLPLVATVAIYIYSRNRGHKSLYFFAAGFIGIVAFFYKYTALPLLLFVYINWLIDVWRQKTPNLLWRFGVSLALGAITATAMVLGYFVMHDGGARLWECTIRFNQYYAASNNFGLAPLWSHLQTFWLHWWILFLIPCAVLLRPKPRIWFWIGMFAVAWLSTGNSLYGHYYILVMPFWALLSAVGIRALSLHLNEWSKHPSKRIGCLITIVVLLLVLRSDVPWLTCSPARFVEVKYAGYPFSESRIVAERIAKLSSGNDFVYVAGSEPEILFYAQRFSPTRFITSYALMIPTPLIKDYQQEAIRDLLTRLPSVIVYVNSSASWMRQEATPLEFFSFLNKFMLDGYERVGGYATDGTKGRWVEPLTDKEMADSSLILFKRKKITVHP